MDPTRRALAKSLASTGLASTSLAWLAAAAIRPALAASAPVQFEAARGHLEHGGRAIDIVRFGDAGAGPLVRARPGDEIGVRLINRLPTPLSLHWLGMRIVNAMDGVAGLTQPPVPPDGRFDYRFAPPDSGTFLCRPCVPDWPLPAAAADGLHAVLVVEEREPPQVDGEFLLAATQWRIDTAGRPAPSEAAATAIVAVNGRTSTETSALPRGARVRLRVANAAPAALLLLAVDGARPSVIAVDSQPCDPFVPARGVIPIGPGARFDLMLDLPQTAGAVVRVTFRDALDTAVRPLAALELTTTEKPAPARATTATLPANPHLPVAIALERAARADFLLDSTPASGAHKRGAARPQRPRVPLGPKLDAAAPILSVERGRPIVFSLVNPSPRPISVHVHGHAMRVLHDLDDGWHPYWRDTVLVEPGKTHHAAFVADNPGKWLVEAVALGTVGSSEARFGWYDVR